SNGTYTATLVVSDAAGRDSTATSMPVTVAAATPPTANPGIPTTGGAGGPPVYFDAAQSSDNAAPGVQQGIVSYFWDMDTATDSDSDGNAANDIDAVGVNPSYLYANAGTYAVRLVVMDGAGQADTNGVDVTVSANRAPQVVIPFYQGDPSAPHPAISGMPHLLKGVARDSGTLRCQWLYGDGTSNSVTTVSDRNKIESAHTYTGTPGQTFTATLRVWDAADNVGEATYTVALVEDTPAARTDLALDLALWWLHKDQNKSTGQWTSMYTDWRGVETVGACINAFQKNGHRLDGNAADNPYVETVRLGYDWLFAKLATVAVSGPADSNNNGIGLKTPDGEYPDVTVSRIIDTLSRAQRHFAMAGTGVPGVKHRHFADLAADLADTLVARQRTDTAYRGSWNRWTTSYGDMAVGMHLALALRSAQRELGVMTPDSLKTENLIWLNRQVRPNGSFGNAYPYPQDSYDFWSATVGGLHFARLHAFDRTQPFWREAERWLDDQPWPLSNNDKSYMMLWGLSAVLREAAPQPITTLWHSGRDWFNDPTTGLRQKLLAEQEASGRWYGYHNPGNSGYLNYALSTALAVDMLSGAPVALLPQPVITAPRYWSYGLPLTLAADLSRHADPSRDIVRYEWDFDGDGTFDFESADPADTNAVFTLPDPTPGVSDPATNITVTLRVTDDAASPKQATASVVIQIGDSPFAPFAVAGGPYLGLTNLAVTVDGSGSYDLDNQPNMHSGITEYQWDFTLDGTVDVASATPTATWSWATPGTYAIRLRVLDDGLFNGSVSLTSEWAEASVVIVANRQPVAGPGGPYAGEEDSPISFTGAASSDPDPGQTLVLYAWDFNGDTVADVSAATPDAQWT
ncbi:MAG: hypothetical protein KBA18_14645, partial [Kiritimatiellae bacterium]|nr:hypothetical protein [Kiritimatiellia bacterium]